MNTASILTGKARKIAYIVYGVIGVVLGATTSALAVYEMADAKWLLAAMAVYTFLGGAFGFVAGDNVVTEELEPLAPPEAVETDLENGDEAPMALINDEEPVEVPHPYDVPVEIDTTPVDDDYEPRH